MGPNQPRKREFGPWRTGESQLWARRMMGRRLRKRMAATTPGPDHPSRSQSSQGIISPISVKIGRSQPLGKLLFCNVPRHDRGGYYRIGRRDHGADQQANPGGQTEENVDECTAAQPHERHGYSEEQGKRAHLPCRVLTRQPEGYSHQPDRQGEVGGLLKEDGIIPPS
jgi:hypothetical protein